MDWPCTVMLGPADSRPESEGAVEVRLGRAVILVPVAPEQMPETLGCPVPGTLMVTVALFAPEVEYVTRVGFTVSVNGETRAKVGVRSFHVYPYEEVGAGTDGVAFHSMWSLMLAE